MVRGVMKCKAGQHSASVRQDPRCHFSLVVVSKARGGECTATSDWTQSLVEAFWPGVDRHDMT